MTLALTTAQFAGMLFLAAALAIWGVIAILGSHTDL